MTKSMNEKRKNTELIKNQNGIDTKITFDTSYENLSYAPFLRNYLTLKFFSESLSRSFWKDYIKTMGFPLLFILMEIVRKEKGA